VVKLIHLDTYNTMDAVVKQGELRVDMPDGASGKAWQTQHCSEILRLNGYAVAVPRLRRLVTDHSLLRPRSVPGSVHVGFVKAKVALGQVFLQVLWFSPVNIIPPWLSVLIYHLGDEQ
jgi:hypothetical protein